MKVCADSHAEHLRIPSQHLVRGTCSFPETPERDAQEKGEEASAPTLGVHHLTLVPVDPSDIAVPVLGGLSCLFAILFNCAFELVVAGKVERNPSFL